MEDDIPEFMIKKQKKQRISRKTKLKKIRNHTEMGKPLLENKPIIRGGTILSARELSPKNRMLRPSSFMRGSTERKLDINHSRGLRPSSFMRGSTERKLHLNQSSGRK